MSRLRNLLGFTSSIIFIIGCQKVETPSDTRIAGSSESSAAETPDVVRAPERIDINGTQATSRENRIPRTEMERYLSFAGIDTEETLENFLSTVRTAAQADDRRAIASLIQYPYRVYRSDEVVEEIETATEFIEQYEQLVPPASQAVLEKMDKSTFWGNWRGGHVHKGSIWFNGHNGDVKITYIAG